MAQVGETIEENYWSLVLYYRVVDRTLILKDPQNPFFPQFSRSHVRDKANPWQDVLWSNKTKVFPLLVKANLTFHLVLSHYVAWCWQRDDMGHNS